MSGIHKPSYQSLFLQMRVNGHDLATGTGFVMFHGGTPYLITNWHNLSGRHPSTGKTLSKTAGIPDEVVIMHNQKGKFGNWIPRTEPVLHDDKPLWIEHPTHAQKVDAVALPLTNLEDVELHPYSLGQTGPDIAVPPADVLSIVGFPFGLTGGGAFAIWATGFMATEPDINQFELPAFLVDCRGRPGQSGSAVIAHRKRGPVTLADGGMQMMRNPITKFLGIYSGRVNDQSDLGIVWKVSAIAEILESTKS